MDAALHGDDAFATKLADDEVTLVPDGRGHRKTGDFAVRDGNGVLDQVGQLAEAAAEDDADNGLAGTDPLPDEFGRIVIGLEGCHRAMLSIMRETSFVILVAASSAAATTAAPSLT